MLTAPLPLLAAIAVRSAVVLLFLLLALRLLGKRQLAQVNLFDLVTIAAVSNAVQNAMTQGRGELTLGLASAGALLLVGWLLTTLVVRLPTLQQRMFGMPTVIINEGKLVRGNMQRERISEELLLATLRQHGLCDPEDVKTAVLEVDGSISVVPYAHEN